MHYGQFAEWVRDKVEELVAFGVPRATAESAMHYVEVVAINAETAARHDRQFLLGLKEAGTAGMAERLGISEQSVRKRRAKILKTVVPVAAQVA